MTDAKVANGRHDNSIFQSRYREVTWSAIIFGVIAGIMMNAAITYAGLKIGFTIGGSAIAAVLGFGVLRGMLRHGTILETNIAQTIASAVNISNSGIIFTVPVLFLLGYDITLTSPDFWLITLAGVAGAILGTAFIIPLRKQMIDIERLRFPTGTAVAAILKSPGAGSAKSLVLVAGILVGMAVYLPTQRTATYVAGDTLQGEDLRTLTIPDEWAGSEEPGGLWIVRPKPTATLPITAPSVSTPDELTTALADELELVHSVMFKLPEEVNVGERIGLPPHFELIFAIAPFALGAGYLTGRAGLYVLAGGILAFFFLTPVAYTTGLMPESITADQAAGFGFAAFNRPLGIGILLGGALMGVLFSLPSIKEALKSIVAAGRTRIGSEELGGKTLFIAVLVAFLLLFMAADFVGNQPLNQICPVTGEDINRQVTPVELDGYAVGFSSVDAADTWLEWDDEQHTDFLATLNAKPGWLAGLNRHARAAVIAFAGTVWIWFAGIIIAQCTGMTDWSPISGMALLTVVLVLALAGSGAVLFAVLIGAALCVATTLAADMMQDMKTGYIVGAQPRRQQLIELAMVGIGPVISMLVLVLISQANIQQAHESLEKAQYVVVDPESSAEAVSTANESISNSHVVLDQGGFGAGTPTTAPQAQALQAVITGVQGGEMPYAIYGIGAVVGALLGLGAFPGLGVLVGLSMYLPFMYIATYGVGCVINMLISKIMGRDWAESWGVPFSAGLIVGESLSALVINMYIVLGDAVWALIIKMYHALGG